MKWYFFNDSGVQIDLHCPWITVEGIWEKCTTVDWCRGKGCDVPSSSSVSRLCPRAWCTVVESWACFFFLFVLYRLFLVFFFSSDTLAMPSLQSTVVTKKCFLSKPKQRECNVAEKSLNMVLQHYSSHAHIKNSDSKSTYYPCFKMHIKLLSQFEKLNIA